MCESIILLLLTELKKNKMGTVFFWLNQTMWGPDFIPLIDHEHRWT